MHVKITALLVSLAVLLSTASTASAQSCAPERINEDAWWVCEPAPGYWLSKDLGDAALQAVERASLVDPLVRTLKELRSDLEASQRLSEAILEQTRPPAFDWAAFGIGTGLGVALGIAAVLVGVFAF